MISPNELRKGNIVFGGEERLNGSVYIEKHNIIVEDIISQKGINPVYSLDGHISGCFPFKDLWPIELTEEWLFNLGAEIFPGGGWLLNNRLISYAECRSKFIDQSTSVELNYVHQLQNLYFALTGKELEVKL